jgi:selenocysteine lyase/cysteine desulfurase
MDRWEQLRRDTPATERVIHLNNAGAALMPRSVVEAITEHLRLEAAMGGYEAAEQKQPEIAAVYASVARLVGAA